MSEWKTITVLCRVDDEETELPVYKALWECILKVCALADVIHAHAFKDPE